MQTRIVTLKQPVISTEVQKKILNLNKRRQVGILGGTFNPPHLGHLIMADQVMQQLELEKVLFMPDNQPPHVDEKKTIPGKDRKEMVSRAIMDNPNFELETIELQRGGISYTYDTIKALKQRHPDTDYYFIIGGDMVAYLPKWHKIDELLKLVHFVGVRRRNFAVHSNYPIIWVDSPLVDISSSAIRKRVKNQQSIHYLVPDDVAAYIYEKGLYLEGK
ncbi:nicotinate-nucleotide adenylyltransferase [Agrilactobacillus yilanensis]|uniref:Probable nicotinate-nucleotide adenylyltransferase n=1 Tax=Agrilactobacillus yilanensis TaxID=2485997 RepID=A0ABW4J8Q5_9LACO